MGSYKRHWQAENDDLRLVYTRTYGTGRWLSTLMSKLPPDAFVFLLSKVDDDMRQRLYDYANQLEVNTLNQIKVFLIAKLNAYIQSNGIDPFSNEFSFFALQETKNKIANARNLISRITHCTTIADIKTKIEDSQTHNATIDKGRMLTKVRGAGWKSTYAECLESCHTKASDYETNESGFRAPPNSPTAK